VRTHARTRARARTHTHTHTHTHTEVRNVVYELPEGGVDVPQHVGVVKDGTFKCVCNLCIKLVS
jgi:hypothetical protein